MIPPLPQANYEIMRRFFLLRASLVPYIYSSARQAYDEGLSLLRPLYYLFPEMDQAYSYDLQYMFGSDVLVAPVTQPVDPSTLMITQDLWIPPVPLALLSLVFPLPPAVCGLCTAGLLHLVVQWRESEWSSDHHSHIHPG